MRDVVGDEMISADVVDAIVKLRMKSAAPISITKFYNDTEQGKTKTATFSRSWRRHKCEPALILIEARKAGVPSFLKSADPSPLLVSCLAELHVVEGSGQPLPKVQ